MSKDQSASRSDDADDGIAALERLKANFCWSDSRDAGTAFQKAKDCFARAIDTEIEYLRTVARSERGTSEPFVHAFSIKRGKEDGWWYLHGEQLVPGLNLAHTDLQTVLDDLLPAWRKLHEVAPQQVPAPPMGLSEIKT